MISREKIGIILLMKRKAFHSGRSRRQKGAGSLSLFSKAKHSIHIYIKNTDRVLILLCALASTYGVALVYSAAHTAGAGRSGYMMQLLASIGGLVLAIGISQFDYEAICALWPVWGGIAVLLIGLTFTPLGLSVAGTDDTAWLAIGRFTFQPSELLKIAFIITFSKHLSSVREHINKPRTVLLLCLHAMAPIGMIALQGDDGTMLVFTLMFLSMMFVAGLKPLYFILGGTGVAAMVPLLWNRFIGETNKLNRILAIFFVDEHLEGAGYQQAEGLKAIGSGQLWGQGFLQGGNARVPARNNDFIFTVAGEEFGFIGALALIVLLVLIIWKIWRCAATARDSLGMYICVGTMSMIGFQSLINIGMTLRVLPVIGITLPFFSSGGSSVATLYLAIGLVLSVYFSSRARVRNNIFTKPA